MTEQRLTDLAILSIESEKAAALDLDEVVDVFSRKEKTGVFCLINCQLRLQYLVVFCFNVTNYVNGYYVQVRM